MTPRVYIPSRGRPQNVPKLIDAWDKQDFDIYFMVEPDEYDLYVQALTAEPAGDPAQILVLEQENRGIGYSRNRCVQHAYDYGHDAVVMADDDIKPAKNMHELLVAAEHIHAFGVTSKYSYHDFMFREKVKGRTDLILLPTGSWRLVGLNINNVMDIGNYDEHMTCAEDADLMLRGLSAGFPWMIHLGTWATSIGNRHATGGLSDYCAATGEKSILDVNHENFHAKHPVFVSTPPSKYRVAWKQAYDEYIPEWHQYSALHGGDIRKYLG